MSKAGQYLSAVGTGGEAVTGMAYAVNSIQTA